MAIISFSREASKAEMAREIDRRGTVIEKLESDYDALVKERDALKDDRDFWKEQFQVETRYRIELADKGTLQALTDANNRMSSAEAERDRLALANAELLADQRETLKAVLYHFGPEGAQKVTAHTLEQRKARALLDKQKATSTEREGE